MEHLNGTYNSTRDTRGKTFSLQDKDKEDTGLTDSYE